MGAKKVKFERSGFVLIVVLCMVMMLSVLLLGFHYEARANLQAVDTFRTSGRALHCARAGLNIAIAAIKDRSGIQSDKSPLRPLSRENTFIVDEGQCSVTISEESGKLNVNFLKDKNGKLNRPRIEQVLRLFDLLNQEKGGHPPIHYGLVPSMIDWTDRDDQVSYLPFIRSEAKGAESSYYNRLKPPYACKNGSFETTEELLLVKGMTPEVFDRVGDYLTVYGDGEININYASAPVLQSLSEEMDAALARHIVERRRMKPFENLTELRGLAGMTESLYNTLRRNTTVESANDHFYVISRGSVDQLTRTVVAILNRNMQTQSVDVILYKEI
jgi:general secretion pathway protein K